MKRKLVFSLVVLLAVSLGCQFLTSTVERDQESAPGMEPETKATAEISEDAPPSAEINEETESGAQSDLLPTDETPADEPVAEPAVNLQATEKAQEDGALGAKEYKERGDSYLNDSAFAEAIEDYTHAVELDKKLYSAFWNRGIAHYSLGEYETALEDIDTTIKLWPGQPNPHYWRGLILYAMGDYEKALEAYDKAIEKTKAANWVNSNWDYIYAARQEAEDALNQ